MEIDRRHSTCSVAASGGVLAVLLLLTGSVAVLATQPGSHSPTPAQVRFSPHQLQLAAGGGVTPPSQSFGALAIGLTSPPTTFTLTNGQDIPQVVQSVSVSGTNPVDFVKSADLCTGQSLAPLGGRCTVDASFRPAAVGPLAAQLDFFDPSGVLIATAALSGIGTPAPTPTTTTTTTTTTTKPAPTTVPVRRPATTVATRPRSTTTTVRRPTITTRAATAIPATTAASTTTTSIVATTTTAPQTTTIRPPIVPGPPRATLAAASVAGHPFGPAGVGLRVDGSHYACRTVYFFFDNTRIGSGRTDRSGRAAVSHIAVPGDAAAGVHQIKSSCGPSGVAVAHSLFRVTTSAQHRTAFVTSLNEPNQISLTLRSVVFSGVIAAAILVLLAFPSQLFNSTLQENYEEVRGWFHLRRPLSEVVQRFDQRLIFPLFVVAGGVLYALLAPGFGWNRSTAALALGLAVAVTVTTLGFALPTFAYFRFRFRDRGQILVLPGTVIVGAVFVALSRLMHFQPGYLYGIMAVFVFRQEVDRRTTGRLAATGTFLVLALAIIAWIARIPVSGATMRPGVGFWSLAVESALAGTFVIGLESTLVSLLPLRFLDGSRIREWNKTVWALLLGLGLWTLVEVLLRPGSGYVGHSSAPAKIAVISLYLACGIGSFAFWAYFRYRSARPVEGLALEGDFGVR